MGVAADTANNVVYDDSLGQYLAFSRTHCNNEACHEKEWGNRREARSVANGTAAGAFMANQWSKAAEVLHGEAGYEMYSLTPWRAAAWNAGVYMAVGSYYVTAGGKDVGSVYCELHSSSDYGRTWLRLAPRVPLIPPGAPGAFDSRT